MPPWSSSTTELPSRRAVVDNATKRANAQIILDVLAAKGGDGRFLRAIAGRESGLNHVIRHLHPADRGGSVTAWRRNRRRFANNPHYYEEEAWDHGKGLFGMMPGYHLHRWDPNAHPDILFNPYVASVAAARLAAGCMRSGAKTWADVDQCWATGSPRRGSGWEARRQRMRNRLRRIGYPEDLVDQRPQPGGWGRGPQDDQLEILWSLSGETPSEDVYEEADLEDYFGDDFYDDYAELDEDEYFDDEDEYFDEGSAPTKPNRGLALGLGAAAVAGIGAAVFLAVR